MRRVAFGDLPRAGDRPLPSGSPLDRWLAAVILGARGEYAAAATALIALRGTTDRVLRSLAAATLAAHRRQLGGHVAARRLDAAALADADIAAASDGGRRDPDGLDARGALADALLGLAADNLALGRLSAARRLIDRAEALEAGWRAAVRAGWVRAEVALMSGDAESALPAAESATRLAEDRGAVRHAIKSRLVLAAALGAAGRRADRDRAASIVTRAAVEARTAGLGSLTWPAGLLAADLHPQRAPELRREVTAELHALLLRSDPQGRRLAYESGWVPAGRDTTG